MSAINNNTKFLRLTLRNILNILIATLGLFYLSPFMLLLSFAVYKKIGSPILFKQLRPGFKGKPFTIYKFRTMTDKRDQDGNLLSDADRLTPFSNFLRSTSLDELPELFNIAKGDMALVGPRPLLMQYLKRYSPRQFRRHEVKPGLTGWAQINGRNNLTWEEKFELDLWYVDHQSITLDLKILMFTIKKVIQRDGINRKGEATTVEFYPKFESSDKTA